MGLKDFTLRKFAELEPDIAWKFSELTANLRSLEEHVKGPLLTGVHESIDKIHA